jgi:flagellar basal body rod protein FlgB
MKTKGLFIVLTHTYVPEPASTRNLSKQNNKQNYQVEEKCEFVTRINNRMISSATVIMDAENRKFVKNRVDYATYDQFESHVSKTHPERWTQFSSLLAKMLILRKSKSKV